MLIFAELLTALVPGAKTTTEGTLQIRSVCIDSRQAVPGSLFVALRGERTDGHRYVGQAFAQGAVAALVEHPPEEAVTIIDTVRGLVPSEIHPPLAIVVADSLQALQRLAATRREARPDLTVVGVTGSVGKTTTKEALAAVLAQRAQTLKSAGNYNNEIGLPLTLLELQPVHRFAVLEMGMYALGEIALLCSIARPQVGVVTNVEPVHLERLGTIERIAMAKAELIGALPQDGVAVLNGDDLRVRAMAERTMARTVTFGLGPENDVRGEKIVGLGWQGIELTVQVAEPDRFGLATSQARLRTPMIGRHAAWPALAATATGLVLGLSWEEIARGLGTHKMNLRLVPKQGIGGVVLLDDTYNSSPASAQAALDLLAELPGRHLAVLGDMLELGAYELEGHRQVGQHCAQVLAPGVDVLIAVGPRARHIADAALAAGMDESLVYTPADNPSALELIRSLTQPGDIVLVKGSRGMAMEQIVDPLTTDDRGAQHG